MKSKIFKTAWAWIKEGLFETFADALRASWAKFRLLTRLRAGLAYFTFTKASGERRTAVGTLHPANFSYKAKTSGREKPSLVVKFWDVEKRAFRSLRIDRFVSFS
jgi:hypothetical protein